MSTEDDTLNAAPAQADTATEQAVPQQTETVTTETTTETTPAPADTVAPPERKWAQKYSSPEVLEESHLDLQRRFTLETQRRAELERQVNQQKPATPAPQTYTPEQIESAKIDLLDKMADARAQGDAAKAREYASQIVWCDRELLNQRMAVTQTQTKAHAAEQSLMQEVAGVIAQFKDDLVPGNALYDKAAVLLDKYVEMGMPNNAITQAHAVTMAAQLMGKTQASVAQDTRRELSKTIQSTLKSGVIAGAGQASNGAPAAVNFLDMTDAQFEAYQKQHGLR